MGILSWFRKGKKEEPAPTGPKPEAAVEAPGMNGAVEVRRPPVAGDFSVFEFGSLAASGEKVTLAGFCPVSEELEPCRWELLPSNGSDAPQFRVVF